MYGFNAVKKTFVKVGTFPHYGGTQLPEVASLLVYRIARESNISTDHILSTSGDEIKRVRTTEQDRKRAFRYTFRYTHTLVVPVPFISY